MHRIPSLVKREGHQLDPASLQDFLKARLAGFKIPKKFIVVEELPKSSTGKLLKREIRNWDFDGLNAP